MEIETPIKLLLVIYTVDDLVNMPIYSDFCDFLSTILDDGWDIGYRSVKILTHDSDINFSLGFLFGKFPRKH